MVVKFMKPLKMLLRGRRQSGSMPPHRRSQRGVALIEALIAILIFTFGILGLIGLEASAINFSVDAEDRSRAALFASEVASYMWINGTVTVGATQLAAWNSTSAATPAIWNTSISNTATVGLPSGVLAVTPTAGMTNTADITITWVPTTDKTSTTRTLTTRVTLP